MLPTKLTSIIIFVSALSTSQSVWAADPQIEIQQSVYSYSRVTTDTRPSNGSNRQATDEGFQTMPTDLAIAMHKDQWEFSVFPTQPGGASFEVLNEIIQHLAVGFDFGDQRQSHDDENYRHSSETIQGGPMAQWEPLSGNHSVELSLILNYQKNTSQAVSKSPSFSLQSVGVSEAEVDARGFLGEFQAMYVQRVTDNLQVGAGGIYSYGRMYDRISDTSTMTGSAELIPLQLRAEIY